MLKFIDNWLNERFRWNDFKSAFKKQLYKPLPKNITDGAGSYLHTFGTVAMALFGLQAITGFLLLMYYKPSAKEAYESVQYIMYDVNFGWLMRQMHAWCANLMVFFVILHMAKVFFYGAYKKPRELNWFVGVIIFSIVLTFAFTGYLLPWDQLAYWATIVGTKAIATLPLIGDFTLKLLWGGETVGDATIGRFFAIHVFLLPAILALLIIIHLTLMRISGNSSPIRTDEKEKTVEELKAEGALPFYPHHVMKESIVIYLTLGIALTLSVFYPFTLQEKANPFVTPEGIRPDWYFLSIFQFIKYVPGALGIVLVNLVGVFLLLLPFIDRSPERDPKKRPLVVRLGIAFIVINIFLGVLGAISERNITIFGKTYHIDIKGIPHRIDKDITK
jgi:quinol-cytochrome oxidoreductase complex cytochrome b subunit